MSHDTSIPYSPTLSELQSWTAFGAGAALCFYGATRRSLPGIGLTIASTPLLYRGIRGKWPEFTNRYGEDGSRSALAGDRGTHVREAVQLERDIAELYVFWRRLANLPRFMPHLESVDEQSDGRSHWTARGPGGVRVEWDAEIVNEVENQVIGWRSLPGSDIVSAGSVNFDAGRNGSTRITVHLQYAPPAGRAGELAAMLLGSTPSQTIREDLRRFKQLLEAGEIAQAGPASGSSR